MKKIFFLGISLSVVTLSVVIFYFFYSIYYEAKNLKEFSYSSSLGNCRIVNSALAIDNGYKLCIINKKGNTDDSRHIIAIDDNNTVYDTSRGTNALPDEQLVHYLNKNNFYVTLMINAKNLHYNYLNKNSSLENFKISFANYLYLYLFCKFYTPTKNFH